MNIGELNRRIIIQQVSPVVSENGFETEAWTDYKTVWASVSNLYGREYFAAMAVNAENTVKFKIRYKVGITTDMRISFGGKYYNINSIDDVDYSHAFMVLRATEVE